MSDGAVVRDELAELIGLVELATQQLVSVQERTVDTP